MTRLERVSVVPCPRNHSEAASRSAPPGPLSGNGELTHSTTTRTASAPSPSPAAKAPPRSEAMKAGSRLPRRAATGGAAGVPWGVDVAAPGGSVISVTGPCSQ
ncbi:hypothetical protein [Streptomyces sp. DfronAA-171]|uniref:hypothetical protein n=1 Tax=Streptomyces sp. DfronAA-171 TaxID=1839777 RepID=UPI00081EA376|nr:hypothetical protein [Streptomyces sp. DfronAA-171]SCE42682.1 hypothetical protein GA0115252_14822 [Streptomyces sp. DfronAA-171]